MNRRHILVSLSALAGHALFPQVLDRFVQMTSIAEGARDWRPELLSPARGRLLAEIVETIIPATDTPGARAAGVHVFVDLMLAHCLPQNHQKAVIAALDALGQGFMTAAGAERIAQLERMDAEALALLKELTILGYFSSEVGATQALTYDKVPGAYRGCIPLAPGQRAWATR